MNSESLVAVQAAEILKQQQNKPDEKHLDAPQPSTCPPVPLVFPLV